MRHFIPCHTTLDASGLAELFVQEVVHCHGLRLTIVLDKGPQVASTVSGQICIHIGIDRRLSTGFNPGMDGQTEQMNGSMEQYLRVLVNHQQEDWVKWLPMAEWAANSSTSETMQCTTVFPVQGADP